ncbi:helix-turn-helix transcriptional regulator [Pseudoclavibacter sp. AY1H1]|uniref:helix-turn-helix transcriptional regulator n=1 Tax=Pseudoclavibacter sp. AY1H1 TaxID=2080584 RepID=UPI00215842BD|nr:helix-turn-helix transcriptional regulator [Pseudoclavibacter sp. AY1H1]
MSVQVEPPYKGLLEGIRGTVAAISNDARIPILFENIDVLDHGTRVKLEAFREAGVYPIHICRQKNGILGTFEDLLSINLGRISMRDMEAHLSEKHNLVLAPTSLEHVHLNTQGRLQYVDDLVTSLVDQGLLVLGSTASHIIEMSGFHPASQTVQWALDSLNEQARHALSLIAYLREAPVVTAIEAHGAAAVEQLLTTGWVRADEHGILRFPCEFERRTVAGLSNVVRQVGAVRTGLESSIVTATMAAQLVQLSLKVGLRLPNTVLEDGVREMYIQGEFSILASLCERIVSVYGQGDDSKEALSQQISYCIAASCRAVGMKTTASRLAKGLNPENIDVHSELLSNWLDSSNFEAPRVSAVKSTLDSEPNDEVVADGYTIYRQAKEYFFTGRFDESFNSAQRALKLTKYTSTHALQPDLEYLMASIEVLRGRSHSALRRVGSLVLRSRLSGTHTGLRFRSLQILILLAKLRVSEARTVLECSRRECEAQVCRPEPPDLYQICEIFIETVDGEMTNEEALTALSSVSTDSTFSGLISSFVQHLLSDGGAVDALKHAVEICREIPWVRDSLPESVRDTVYISEAGKLLTEQARESSRARIFPQTLLETMALCGYCSLAGGVAKTANFDLMRNRIAEIDSRTLGSAEDPEMDSLNLLRQRLPPRQVEIAHLASAGLTNREISDRLGLTVRTVENNLYRAFRALGIRSRVEIKTLLTYAERPAPQIDEYHNP